ncbi:MAG: twin-arginine translocation signal domain-containing protein [Pirellulales bacterium]
MTSRASCPTWEHAWNRRRFLGTAGAALGAASLGGILTPHRGGTGRPRRRKQSSSSGSTAA